jgi:hypothetical protein
MIEGNKKCEVKVLADDGSDYQGFPPREVMPGSFTTVGIHGAQVVSVVEVGEFIS